MSARPRARGLTESVLARLRNLARQQNRAYAELLQLYGLERYLYRLSRSAQSDRFVLKGALMMRVWDGTESRPTRDIDLHGPADISAGEVEHLIRECAQTQVQDDGVELDLESLRVTRIRIPDQHVVGFRAKFDGFIAKTKLRYQIDVGAGDVVVPDPVMVIFPTLLEFPSPRLRAYTPYTTIAEKFEAMVKLELANTRMKDYFDLAALADRLTLDGPTLANALRGTFAGRAIKLPASTPLGLGPEFVQAEYKEAQWKAFVRKNRLEDRALPFADTVMKIRDFLMPAVSAVARDELFKFTWTAGGPWRGSNDGEFSEPSSEG